MQMIHILSCAVVNEQCQLKDLSVNMDSLQRTFACMQSKRANRILT